MSFQFFHAGSPYSADFLLANRFLKQHKQATAGKLDQLYLVKQASDIIGAAWLRPFETHSEPVFWLRSLYLLPNYRQQKLGSALITFMQTSTQPNAIYGFAKPELAPFYQSLGFQTMIPSELPSSLKIQLESYSLGTNRPPAWQIFAFRHTV